MKSLAASGVEIVLTPKLCAAVEARVQRGRGCWPWQGNRLRNGYGVVYYAPAQRSVYAHRVAYKIAHPRARVAGRVVMHTCDVRACCNPAHLQLGSQGENVRDAWVKRRLNVPPLLRGSDHPSTPLTERDVREIKLALRRGVPGKHLAVQYGVVKTTISNIKHGRNWAHVKV